MRTCSRWHRVFYLFLVLPFAWASFARAQTAKQVTPHPGAVGATLRSCSANPVLTSASKKAAKSKHPLPAEPPPVCREVAGEAVDLQEFLQAQGRTQDWRMGENRASEDSWSYVRYFGTDELDKYADTASLAGAVKFSGGKAAVIVRTTDIGSGFVRVQVTAHFQGEGKSTDSVLGRPATEWPLASKGILENELFSAIEKSYRPLQ
jgi:hypothetical protein